MKNLRSAVITVALVLGVAATLRSPTNRDAYDVTGFGRLPVLVNGRIKPLDTVARTTLLLTQGRQRVKTLDGRSLTPGEWLLDVLCRPHEADQYPTFEITHPDVLGLLNLSPGDGAGGKRFAARQFAGGLADLDRQSKLADATESALRTPFQKAVIQLRDAVALYQRLQNTLAPANDDSFFERLPAPEVIGDLSDGDAKRPGSTANAQSLPELERTFSTMDALGYFRPVPPVQGEKIAEWKTLGAALSETIATRRSDSSATHYVALVRAWRARDAGAFNTAVTAASADVRARAPSVFGKARAEVRFNAAQPFYTSAILYVVAFLLAIFSWLKWPEALRRASLDVVVVAFLLATAGIATRMWLEARPPVTNLYSSALFVGWGAVGLCIVLEIFFKNAIGCVAAGLIGFASLVIAHHLALGGDTLEMMRAVLDSNFWLATHVVTVTVGYSATFLAGFLGAIYVLRGALTRSLDEMTAKALVKMIYGIVCFATLFSFVGTVLGGIWADQSWGRFWGWDPKENGALLIVMWNAIVLHARWGGLVQGRGLAALVIFGNVITAWSWFGVNMLGVGLHSYGFMDAAFWWLIAFVISQVILIVVALLPDARWASRRLVGQA
jgi:ABC-type transport system involved in cytochrome c biogenesis permease subunit